MQVARFGFRFGQWRTGEYRVGIYRWVGDNRGKLRLIPHDAFGPKPVRVPDEEPASD